MSVSPNHTILLAWRLSVKTKKLLSISRKSSTPGNLLKQLRIRHMYSAPKWLQTQSSLNNPLVTMKLLWHLWGTPALLLLSSQKNHRYYYYVMPPQLETLLFLTRETAMFASLQVFCMLSAHCSTWPQKLISGWPSLGSACPATVSLSVASAEVMPLCWDTRRSHGGFINLQHDPSTDSWWLI